MQTATQRLKKLAAGIEGIPEPTEADTEAIFDAIVEATGIDYTKEDISNPGSLSDEHLCYELLTHFGQPDRAADEYGG